MPTTDVPTGEEPERDILGLPKETIVIRATGTRDDMKPFAEPPKHPVNREAMTTSVLDPKDLVGDAAWFTAIASLERIHPQLVYALRLGVLSFIQECARAMALPGAKPDLVNRMREMNDWLSKIPFER